MNAPDKIYTCYNIEEGEKRQLWSTVLLSDVEQVGEYIRKDALLEWAKDMKAETEDVTKQHPEDESLWAEMHWWEVVIAKINAM